MIAIWTLFWLFHVYIERTEGAGSNLACYYTMWSSLRSSPSTYLPEHIDPFLCTHLIYSSAKIGRVGKKLAIQAVESQLELDPISGLYKKVTDLKLKNPDLKVLVSVSKIFESAKDSLNRKSQRAAFILQMVNFLKENRFDGLNLNFGEKFYH